MKLTVKKINNTKVMLTPESGISITVVGKDNVVRALRSLGLNLPSSEVQQVEISEERWDKANKGSLL